MIDDLLSINGTIWAHNGGRYDTIWFLGHIIKRHIKADIRCAGQRIVSLRVGSLIVRDSMAVVPLSLAKAATIAGSAKAETTLPCICGESKRSPSIDSLSFDEAGYYQISKAIEKGKSGCGGYCSIRRNMPADKLEDLKRYLEQDCKVTRDVLLAIQEYADTHDLDLCGTIGASAWSTAMRAFGVQPAEWASDMRGDSTVYEFARSGYYGGRTQAFAVHSTEGQRLDINSAYPAALASLALPVGRMTECSAADAGTAYSSGKEGVFRAIVDVPPCHIPPLPVRSGRINYPYGALTGEWTGYELRNAERVGATIRKIVSALVWDSSEKVLAPFCQQIWGLRHAADKKSGLGSWLKLYANSLTGKLAQNPNTERIYICPDKENILFCPADYPCADIHPSRKCCLHRCTYICGAWKALDNARDAQINNVYVKKTYSLGECSHVHWAAYLTAHARCELHTQLISDGKNGETAIYCDTDSCFAEVDRVHNIGDGLGQWNDEGRYLDFQAIAPKTYSFIDPETGEFIAKSKGIPDANLEWDRLVKGEKIRVDRGVKSFKSAAKSGELFSRKILNRGIIGSDGWIGDRKLHENGRTYPVDIGELRR